MASVEPVCRRSKYLARAKPQERTKYICYDPDCSARHTVVIKPRTLPRRVEQMLQRPSQLLANISAFMYSNLRGIHYDPSAGISAGCLANQDIASLCKPGEAPPVACGAASHLRLKQYIAPPCQHHQSCRMWSGFSSEIETHQS